MFQVGLPTFPCHVVVGLIRTFLFLNIGLVYHPIEVFVETVQEVYQQLGTVKVFSFFELGLNLADQID